MACRIYCDLELNLRIKPRSVSFKRSQSTLLQSCVKNWGDYLPAMEDGHAIILVAIFLGGGYGVASRYTTTFKNNA
jgi:hypothetical protein